VLPSGSAEGAPEPAQLVVVVGEVCGKEAECLRQRHPTADGVPEDTHRKQRRRKAADHCVQMLSGGGPVLFDPG